MGMNYAEQLTASFVDELEKIGEAKRLPLSKEAAFTMAEKLKRLQERREPPEDRKDKEAAARPK